MTYDIACVLCGESRPTLPDTEIGDVLWLNNSNNDVSPAHAYQILLNSTESEILIYLHSDLDIHDTAWIPQVLAPFENENIVAVGLGGATGLGNRDLYRKRYFIGNMARRNYASNATDWQTHGGLLTEPRRVAVIEQYFMAIRTQWLRDIGGWPTDKLSHHMLDGWLACEAARRGKEIWAVPVHCTHRGGSASTGEAYANAKWLQGGNRDTDHSLPHRWIFESYRDTLPIEL